MPTRPSAQRDDRGETLVELVVAIAILGIAAVAILAGLEMSVRTSDQHRRHAESGTHVRSFAEAIQQSVDTNAGYKTCGNVGSYASLTFPGLPAGYTPAVVSVKKWNGSAWVACAGTDDGLGTQQLELTVTSPGDAARRVVETLIVVVRKPCNGPATTTADMPCNG
jgi:prepilin-type N-terminal cleavage/methylation domain-containing protein